MDLFAMITINVHVHMLRNIRESYEFRAEVAPFPFLVLVFSFGWMDRTANDVICRLNLVMRVYHFFGLCIFHASAKINWQWQTDWQWLQLQHLCFSAGGQFRLHLGERVEMRGGARLAKPIICVIEQPFPFFGQIIWHIANGVRIVIIKPSFDISDYCLLPLFSHFLQRINSGGL